MALGAKFQKLRGGAGGWLNSQKGKGAKFSEAATFLRATMFFLQMCYFYGNIVIDYLYRYVYSNIFDIAESSTQWPYLAIQPSNVVLVGRSIVNLALLSTFQAVQYL